MEKRKVEKQTKASDLINPPVRVTAIALKKQQHIFFAFAFLAHLANNIPILIYPAPIKILPRGPRISHKTLVGISRIKGSDSLTETNYLKINPKIIKALQIITICMKSACLFIRK